MTSLGSKTSFEHKHDKSDECSELHENNQNSDSKTEKIHDNKQNNTNYRWVPEDFLKGIFLIPNNFYAPEKEHHSQYVNDHLRYDLFYDAYSKVRYYTN